MNCTLRLFADDTKLYSAVSNQMQQAILQTNILSACEWAKSWQMVFNKKKCKHMHVGNRNSQPDRYSMKDAEDNVTEINKS